MDTDEQSQEADGPKPTETEWLAAQRLAIEANERTNKDANEKTIASRARESDEQRRIVAINFALASFGLSPQCISPPQSKLPEADIIKRARAIDDFIRGAPAEVIQIGAPRAAPSGE